MPVNGPLKLLQLYNQIPKNICIPLFIFCVKMITRYPALMKMCMLQTAMPTAAAGKIQLTSFYWYEKTSEILFDSFTEEALNNSGTANGNPATAASMGFTAISHSNTTIKKYWKKDTCLKTKNPSPFKVAEVFLLLLIR